MSPLFFVPLHRLNQGCCLQPPGFAALGGRFDNFPPCFINVSAFKTVYSTNFCAVPRRFPYPVGRLETISPSLGGGGESRQCVPRCRMPCGLQFCAALPGGKRRSAGWWELPRAHLWLSPSETHGQKCNNSG